MSDTTMTLRFLKDFGDKMVSTDAFTTLTRTEMNDAVKNLVTIIQDECGFSTYIEDDNTLTYTIKSKYRYSPIEKLTVENVSKTNLISISEERLIEYIETNFGRDYIREYGSYVYQVIQEKAYEIITEVLKEQTDYVVDDIDTLTEAVFERIDFDYMYDIIDDILEQPVTIEEKLADIGMSQKDFL